MCKANAEEAEPDFRDVTSSISLPISCCIFTVSFALSFTHCVFFLSLMFSHTYTLKSLHSDYYYSNNVLQWVPVGCETHLYVTLKQWSYLKQGSGPVRPAKSFRLDLPRQQQMGFEIQYICSRLILKLLILCGLPVNDVRNIQVDLDWDGIFHPLGQLPGRY